MAFNPFANFRKYQKFWMATILLVTMFTFVLCTGVGQGDLSDRLLQLFRPRGSAFASIDGDNVYGSEFHELKERRNIANDFMRKASKLAVEKMDEVLKPENLKKLEEKDPKARQELQRVGMIRDQLERRGRLPRFFADSGVKAEELLDFKVWLAEADRLGIQLTDDAVRKLAKAHGGYEWFSDEVWFLARQDVRGQHPKVNDSVMLEILRDEFRAHLAQQAVGYAPTRLALTPGQMWDYFKEKRVEYRETLLPLYVEDFVAQVGEPNEVELQIFFDQHRSTPYDPTQEKIGFAQPAQARVAWLSGDPDSKDIKELTKRVLKLQTNPPFPGPILAPWQVIGASLAKSKVLQDVYEASRTARYLTSRLTEAGAEFKVAEYVTRKDPLTAAAVFLAGARPDAFAAVMPSYASMAILDEKRFAKDYQSGVKAELKRRATVYATLPLMGAIHHGMAIPGAWDALNRETIFLPIEVVQDEMLELLERKQARDWVQTHMRALKALLERPNINTRVGIDRSIEKYVEECFQYLGKKVAATKTLKELGLELVETKELYSKFTIQEAKELEPLRKAFAARVFDINSIEGRSSAPETMLKDDDFWKMFFSDERFSATGRLYEVKPWPPAVTVFSQLVQRARLIPDDPQFRQIAQLAENVDAQKPVVMQLFPDAERPFLFWRTADKAPQVPQKLDDVRKMVVDAWKLNKARETILLKRAREIAEAVAKSANPNRELDDALKKLNEETKKNRDVIQLPRVSPLVPTAHGGQFGLGQRDYEEFSLPPDLIPYPRKDMAADLLGLYDLKKAIEIGYNQVDDINKSLYKQISKEKKPQGKFVQVLTNRPQTVFYIAIVVGDHISHIDFNIASKEASRHDRLYDRGRDEMAKRMREDFMKHLHRIHEVHQFDPLKNFDGERAN